MKSARTLHRLSVVLAVAGLVALTAGRASPADRATRTPRPVTDRRAELRVEARRLFAKREAARKDPRISLKILQRDLEALGDSLEAAGFDSLASRAFYKAAGVASRINADAAGEKDLRRAVHAATRARDQRDELFAVSYLAEFITNRDPDEAIAFLEPKLPRFERFKDPLLLGDAFASISRAYGHLGRWPEQLGAATRAAEAYARNESPARQAYALTLLSQALRLAGRHEASLALADSAIRFSQRRQFGLPLSRAMLARAAALNALGRREEGLQALEACVRLDHARRDRSHEVSARMALAQGLVVLHHPQAALAHLDTLATLSKGNSDVVTETRSAAVRAEALLALRRYKALDAFLTRALPRFERFRSTADRPEDQASIYTHGGAAWGTWVRSRLERGQTEEAWRLAERARSRVLLEQLGPPERPALREVQQALRGASAALIEFLDAGTGLVGFVVTADSLVALEPDASTLEDDVEIATAAFTRRKLDASGRAALVRVGRAVLGPIHGHVPDGVVRLLVTSPAALNGLPFEALPLPWMVDENLGELYAVTYVTSAATWMALNARPVAEGTCVVFADPELRGDDSPLAGQPEYLRSELVQGLPRARDEAFQVAGAHGVAVLGREATLGRLRREAHDAGVLHFATHARIDPSDASRTGLLLSGTDGFVTPAQVESLQIVADLVTLSACRAARGPVYASEGTFDLARAFFVAGARSVITSLWEVSDRGAQRFMMTCYEELRAGRARDQAVRTARAELRKGGFPPRDVYAFVLLGVGDEPVRSLESSGR